MDLFGTTRSRVRRSHALIAPDSFVSSDLPGWERSRGVILIAPRMGAQVHPVPRADGSRTAPRGRPRRASSACSMSSRARSPLTLPDVPERVAGAGRVRVLAAGCRHRDSRGHGLPAQRVREAICPPARHPAARPDLRQRARRRRHPFLGDPDAILKVLLPTDPGFDLAVNVFTLPARRDLADGRGPRDGARPADAGGAGGLSPRRRLVSGPAGRRHLDGALLPAMVRGDGQGARALPLLQGREPRPDGGEPA